MRDFDYLLDKIIRTPLSQDPFRHLYIEKLFNDDHFEQIVTSPEIKIPRVRHDEALIAELHKRNFREIEFPGTTTNLTAYLKWHRDRPVNRMTDVNCEGFGVTLRLQKTRAGTILAQIGAFFRSPRFWQAIASRFDIDLADVRADIGLQKYLDGYEISPHPDIRGKALTFMINVNPAEISESIDYHTQYLKFKPEYEFIRKYWAENPKVDRCWVSWDSCDVMKQQRENNSMVVFSPADDTLHAVKANYDHLKTQRTQYYGNLWYKHYETTNLPRWNEILGLARVMEPTN